MYFSLSVVVQAPSHIKYGNQSKGISLIQNAKYTEQDVNLHLIIHSELAKSSAE